MTKARSLARSENNNPAKIKNNTARERITRMLTQTRIYMLRVRAPRVREFAWERARPGFLKGQCRMYVNWRKLARASLPSSLSLSLSLSHSLPLRDAREASRTPESAQDASARAAKPPASNSKSLRLSSQQLEREREREREGERREPNTESRTEANPGRKEEDRVRGREVERERGRDRETLWGLMYVSRARCAFERWRRSQRASTIYVRPLERERRREGERQRVRKSRAGFGKPSQPYVPLCLPPEGRESSLALSMYVLASANFRPDGNFIRQRRGEICRRERAASELKTSNVTGFRGTNWARWERRFRVFGVHGGKEVSGGRKLRSFNYGTQRDKWICWLRVLLQPNNRDLENMS